MRVFVLILAFVLVACGGDPANQWSELQGGKAEMTASRASQLPKADTFIYRGTGTPKEKEAVFFALSVGTGAWNAVDLLFPPTDTSRTWQVDFTQSILGDPQEAPSVVVVTPSGNGRPAPIFCETTPCPAPNNDANKAGEAQFFAPPKQVDELNRLDARSWQVYTGAISLSQTVTSSANKARIFFKYAPLGLFGGDGRLRVQLIVRCQSGC